MEELTSGAQYNNNCQIINSIYGERQYVFQNYLQNICANDSRLTDHIATTTLCKHTELEQFQPDLPRLNNEDI